jgi:membrane protease YdiL (CAAX protease family)
MSLVAGIGGVGQASARIAFEWKWCRWTRWPLTVQIVVVAVLTVAFDLVTTWLHFNLGHLGRVPISPTLPIELLLAAMVGWRRLGLDRANLNAWREFLIIAGAALVFGVWQYSLHTGGFGEAMGLVLAALDEEFVYRLAVLILVGATCAKLAGRNWRNAEDWGVGPGVIAILASGVIFALLPGHLAQMSDGLHALPFVCLGMVLGYAVLRTGALFPAAVVHALLNLATIGAFNGDLSHALRSSLSAAALVALVLGTVVAGRRLGIFRLVPVVERVAAAA